MKKEWRGIIEEYHDFLPVSEQTPIITLGEGGTPLIKAENLSRELDFNGDIYLKCDGFNPTGSFKDRGMSLAVSKAKEEKAKIVICASTGNAAASAAAYTAKAGLDCLVLVPSRVVSPTKLLQVSICGAKIIKIKGTFTQAVKLTEEVVQASTNSIKLLGFSYQIQGFKTAAFEICDSLGRAPDYHFIPVGNGGNITANWQGYKEYYQRNKISLLPLMMGFQAEGAAPIVKGKPIENPKTIATAIQVGNPRFWQETVRIIKESLGLIDTVSDKEILKAYKLIAQLEGIFCEPAAAVSVAGLIKIRNQKKNFFKPNALVVCTLTGCGRKDLQVASRISEKPVEVEAKIEEIMRVLDI